MGRESLVWCIGFVFVAMACVPGLAEEGEVYVDPRQGATYDPATEGGIYVEPKQGDTFEEPKQSYESTLTVDSNGKTIARDFSRLVRTAARAYGVANPGRIVNGLTVKPAHKYRWHVGIKNRGDRNYWCGGSIINNKYVMTAAHCMFMRNGNSRPINLLRVGVADYNMHSASDNVNGVTRQVRVQKVIIHPQYSRGTLHNDIALLKLRNPLDLSKNKHLRAVCLPPNDSKTYAGVMATATGWGRLHYSGPQPPVLQKVSLRILPSCSGMSGITVRKLCAGYKIGGKDTCQGDSGGPLVVMEGSKYVQVGITSWGHGCANKNSPGVYTRVSKFLKWIRNNTADATYSCHQPT